MPRHTAVLTVAGGLLLLGCGAAGPREDDIYHDPALRPTTLEASQADRALLAQLSTAGGESPVEAGGRTVLPAYHAASGRLCREVSGETPALVCELRPGEWAFVPHVVSRSAP